MTIGELIKDYRKNHGMSMAVFAEKCSLSKGYISMLENNTNPQSNKPIAPTLPTYKKIATGMDIDLDCLLKKLDADQAISLCNESSSVVEKPPLSLSQQIDAHYGAGSVAALELYCQLDEGDKGNIRGRMELLLESDKYTLTQSLKNA